MASNQVGVPGQVLALTHTTGAEWLPSPSASTGEWPFTAVSLVLPADGSPFPCRPRGQSDVTVTVTDPGQWPGTCGARSTFGSIRAVLTRRRRRVSKTDSARWWRLQTLPAGSLL